MLEVHSNFLAGFINKSLLDTSSLVNVRDHKLSSADEKLGT